jgi:hypothetical protein
VMALSRLYYTLLLGLGNVQNTGNVQKCMREGAVGIFDKKKDHRNGSNIDVTPQQKQN